MAGGECLVLYSLAKIHSESCVQARSYAVFGVDPRWWCILVILVFAGTCQQHTDVISRLVSACWFFALSYSALFCPCLFFILKFVLMELCLYCSVSYFMFQHSDCKLLSFSIMIHLLHFLLYVFAMYCSFFLLCIVISVHLSSFKTMTHLGKSLIYQSN